MASTKGSTPANPTLNEQEARDQLRKLATLYSRPTGNGEGEVSAAIKASIRRRATALSQEHGLDNPLPESKSKGGALDAMLAEVS